MFKNAAVNKGRTGTRTRTIRTAIVAAALACAALFALSACQTSTEPNATLTPELESGATVSDGVLTVGINGSDSPYGGTNGSGETVGLDVDVAAALADELGMKLQIVDVGTDARSALENKQVDLALGQTQSNASKPTTVSYTDAYINDGASLFCLSSNAPKSITSLKVGKGKVLVQANTSAAYAVQEALGVSSVQATETMRDAFDALESGQQKYLVADAVIGDYFARDYSDIERVDFISSTIVSPVYGMTLSSSTELTSAVNEAIENISDNGVLRVVAAKWLGAQGEDLLPGNVDLSKLPETAFGSK